jgi:hypothetical protein
MDGLRLLPGVRISLSLACGSRPALPDRSWAYAVLASFH